MGSLNYTKSGLIDYNSFKLEDPPRFLPYSFEEIDWREWASFVNRNVNIVYYVGAVYISIIFGLQRFMRDKAALDLRRELFLWNGALGIFSAMGFIRFSPEFFHQLLQPGGFYNSICVRQGGNQPIAFWSILFTFSKFVELGDTVFIVLRKKPLTFLQWYHHLVTMIACWVTAPFIEPISRYYCVMNYLVHSLMYPYFALRAWDIKIPRKIANCITTLQLSQMLVGLFVNVYSAILYYWGTSCHRHPTSLKLFLFVYGSFVYLFADLFYNLVFQKKNRSNKTKIM